MREGNAPAGVTGRGLVAADDLGPPVVKACREQRWRFASTRQSQRRLFKPGWQLQAGRDGRHRCRRHRPATLVLTKPQGSARDRALEAGWRQVSHLGARHVVVSRNGTATTILGLVTDDPALAAADVIRPDDTRWTLAPWVHDVQPLLGRGPSQQRAYGAAVIHRPLGCCASARLPHLRIAHPGAQGHRTPHQAADLATAAAQDQRRRLRWEDLITSLKEESHDQPMIEEPERLRVACTEQNSVNMSSSHCCSFCQALLGWSMRCSRPNTCRYY
jgi:hypothetical protein